nr:hypothetical protein [Neorhizobium galegae]
MKGTCFGKSRKQRNSDEVPATTPFSAENICRKCSGKGQVGGARCPDCNGTGKVNTPVGGAG